MPRKRRSRSASGHAGEISERNSNETDDEEVRPPVAGAAPPQLAGPAEGNRVAIHVRDRQRAVAEREAARLARPDRRPTRMIAHADRKKSAVTSTPFGILHKASRAADGGEAIEDKEEEWCGPFSVARQMIAKREEAKRKREEEQAEHDRLEHHPLDALMDQVNMEQKRKAHPSMGWKSKIGSAVQASATGGSLCAKRQKRIALSNNGNSRNRIPSLFQLCVNFIVHNFEYVESLGDVDNDVRLAISKELAGRNQLDGKAFEALLNGSLGSIETLEVVDCAGIPQDTMAAILADMSGLRYLLLTHAGRSFGSRSVSALIEKNCAAQLCCLDIAGAYLLKDEDAARLIKKYSPTLQSVAFSTCPLLGEQFVNAIVDTKSNGINLLELSLQHLNLTLEHLQTLTCSPESKVAFKGIKALTLQSFAGLTDDHLANLLETIGESLDSLNVSFNLGLTDASLSAIRQYNSRLKRLVLNGIKELSAAGLEALFTHPLHGLPPPPKLKVLHLASVDHQAVTDDVLRLVTASSSLTADAPVDNATSMEVVGRRNGGSGLVHLDIQGSTLVTDTCLEDLVETSCNTLQEINVSYCPLITDKGLGYLVSKVGKQLKNIQVWGCAQLTDDFFEGHDRVQDDALEISGAWMKRSGFRSKAF